jgi:hypothetical protein
MRWAVRVARIGATTNKTGLWWLHLKEREYLKDVRVRTILKWLLSEQKDMDFIHLG